MSWRMKVKLLMMTGKTRDQAIEEVLDERDAQIKHMDEKLAHCMNFLDHDQMVEIFGNGDGS